VSAQPELSRLSPELAQGVTTLARELVAATRNWTLYPREHPAVRGSFERLSQAIHAATSDAELSVGITPDALLIEGHPVPTSPQVVEVARLLHDRDLLSLSFLGSVPADAVTKLLMLLAMDGQALREGGGPEQVWADNGDPSIALEQVDYGTVLEDKGATRAQPHDDIWKAIVNSIIFGHTAMDEMAQQRLLDIAGDPEQIGDLAAAVMAPKCAMDGSPMITTQAVTVLAAFRHLAGIVSVKAADKSDDTMRNLATASAGLDPHVVLRMMQSEDEANHAVQVVRGLSGGFDDAKVAQLLATALAADGQASGRLADVFDTIAPDPERKRRVLAMTRTMLSESAFGQTRQFTAIWSSMEELLISYNDKPYVSEDYRGQLEGAAARGVAAAGRDLPEELPEWLDTLGQQSVRRLSVQLIVDLLRLERDSVRAAEIADDMTALAEDLLMAGDYTEARDVCAALNAAANNEQSLARAACRTALTALAQSPGMHETVGALGELEQAQLEIFSEICRLVGPAIVDTLAITLSIPQQTPAQTRGADLIAAFGAPAVPRLASLVDDARPYVQCVVAELLGRIASPEAVPLLQPMLRRNDPNVTRVAISALANINDPAAARAIHTVLRSATGEQRRAVVEALVTGRDVRVVPMLERILQESEPLGSDHAVVLDTLDALKMVHTDHAVGPIDRVMRQKRWFARSKSRALKSNALDTLASIGSDAAKRALAQAARDGDRILRKLAGTKLSESGH
jgi:HEAT repeats